MDPVARSDKVGGTGKKIAAGIARRDTPYVSGNKPAGNTDCDPFTPTTESPETTPQYMRPKQPFVLPLILSLLLSGCASLGQVLQPPIITVAPDQQAQISLLAPSVSRPLGGASVRLYAEITNPNPFGFTLSTVQGQLALEGVRAADVDLPLGLPLAAGQSSVVPLDILLSFSEVPRLADMLGQAFTRQELGYELVGRIGVDAGALGQPTFGPMTLLEGEVAVRR